MRAIADLKRTIPILALAALAGCATPAAEPDALAKGPAPAASPSGGAPFDLTERSGASCRGTAVKRGGQTFLALGDGTLVTAAPLDVVADGARYAYHPENRAGGAILHRCNAGEVRLADGTAYEGGRSSEACTGRFERDARRIEDAGWADGSVGAIRWHGIAAEGSAKVGSRRVPRVRPLLRDDGFYISQTALTDESKTVGDPARYADAASVPYAVVRRDQGVPLGTYGVALRTRGCPRGRQCEPVPFVVADFGPAAGRGSLALSYEVSGLALPDRFDTRNRYRGQVGGDGVLTVFFGGTPGEGPLDAAAVADRARAAFEAWGGEDRLYRCRRVDVPALRSQS